MIGIINVAFRIAGPAAPFASLSALVMAGVASGALYAAIEEPAGKFAATNLS